VTSLFNANLFTAVAPLLPGEVYIRLRALTFREDRLKAVARRGVGRAPLAPNRAHQQNADPRERGEPRHEDHAGAHVGQHG
jgi:hypothetical protein